MLNKIHIDNIDKKIKSIFSIFFISIIAYGFTSCADSMEDTFLKFTHVPFLNMRIILYGIERVAHILLIMNQLDI